MGISALLLTSHLCLGSRTLTYSDNQLYFYISFLKLTAIIYIQADI